MKSPMNLLRAGGCWLRALVILIACFVGLLAVAIRVALAYVFSDRMPTEQVERAVELGSRAPQRTVLSPAPYPLSAYQQIGDAPLWLFDAAWNEADPREGVEDVPTTPDAADAQDAPAAEPETDAPPLDPATSVDAVMAREDRVRRAFLGAVLTPDQLEELLDMAHWYEQDPQGVFTSLRIGAQQQQSQAQEG